MKSYIAICTISLGTGIMFAAATYQPTIEPFEVSAPVAAVQVKAPEAPAEAQETGAAKAIETIELDEVVITAKIHKLEDLPKASETQKPAKNLAAKKDCKETYRIVGFNGPENNPLGSFRGVRTLCL